ncbi:MAG: hypothetical protein R2769_13010 [Saprospiraceae bacterium]
MSSCDKCTDIDCFSPPNPLFFSIVDSLSNNDWFIENGIDPTFVKIYSIGESRYHPIQFDLVDSVYRFSDSEIGWENGGLKTDYRIEIDTVQLPFKYETSIINRDCCSFYELIEADFGPYLQSSNTSENFFKLKL